MGTLQKILIEDERVKLYDRDACSGIYWKAREYFVDNPETRLSDNWGSVRVTPVNQPVFDYVRADGSVNRKEVDFTLSVSAIRKRDGLTFVLDISIPVRFKGMWEAIAEFFKKARRIMESYTDCACLVGRPCSDHGTAASNEALLPK